MKRIFVFFIAVCCLFLVELSTIQSSALAASTDRLVPGQSIGVGDSLSSANGRYNLILQRDGNLVLYRVSPIEPLWDSETDGDGATSAILQRDGNFVVYGSGGPLWDSETDGERIAYAVLQNDGNFVLYRPNGSAVWATGTNEPPPEPPGRKEYCCSVYRSDGSLRRSETVTASDQGDAESQCAFIRDLPPPSPRAEVRRGSC